MSIQRQINRRAVKRTPSNHVYEAGGHRYRTSGMTAQQINKPDKGQLYGACNRTACQKPDANWFNTSTRAYYCQSCAIDITRYAKEYDGFNICFFTTGDIETDARMKFGQEY